MIPCWRYVPAFVWRSIEFAPSGQRFVAAGYPTVVRGFIVPPSRSALHLSGSMPHNRLSALVARLGLAQDRVDADAPAGVGGAA